MLGKYEKAAFTSALRFAKMTLKSSKPVICLVKMEQADKG